jgi:hypothetical protein
VPGAPDNAEYLLLAANGVLTQYRIISLGNGLDSVDGGPTGLFTLSVDETELVHNSLSGLTTGNPHSQYLLGTILAANGDLLTRVAGSPAALAIGSAGQVLTVSGGLPAWAAPTVPTYAGFLPQTPSQRYLSTPALSVAATNSAVTANRLYLRPVPVLNTQTFDQIAIDIQTGSAGNVRFGIYGPFTGDWATLPLALDCGTTTTGSTGLRSVSISKQLTPGWYLLAAVFDATPTVRSLNANNTIAPLGSGDLNANIRPSNFWYAFTYGVLPSPSTTTPTFDLTTAPTVALRAA